MAEDKKNKAVTPLNDTYGHLPPQAIPVEETVLGALMIDNEVFSVIGEKLEPDTFYDKRHQRIYTAIRELALNEKPTDMLAVVEQLRKDGNLESIGGPEYVMELTEKIVSTANIDYYAEVLRGKYVFRQLIGYASMIQTAAFQESTDVDELMQTAESDLFSISQKNIVQDYTHIGPVVDRAMNNIQEASKNESGLSGLTSGYEGLDKMTSGWQPSDLVIIAGRPAMGKTSFALSMAKNMAVDYKIPVAIFSLEMNNEQLTQRFISNICEVEGSKILSGQLAPDEWERLDNNVRRLSEAPIYLDDTPGLSIFELRTKARRLVKEHDIKMIMIDYLQLMNATGMRFVGRQEEVSMISRSLKGLAKELNIPIVALSQLNRGLESREGLEGKRPQLSDLRESGAIEQDADMVIFVHRPEYFRIYRDEHGRDLHGMAQIIIAKHRKGAVGDVLLKFRGEFTRFENPNDDDFQKVENEGEIIGSRLNGDADNVPPLMDVPPMMSSPSGELPF